ncbi:hypothetical protein [Flavilitoribacter nigricans]|uniref:hypothetical protein n=1 Tax=Flavilitoribacter nigricans TaxID=70997 RepID=UPI00117B80EF|nr:hypothetical protein [Flavilitoribacter nigricans]
MILALMRMVAKGPTTGSKGRSVLKVWTDRKMAISMAIAISKSWSGKFVHVGLQGCLFQFEVKSLAWSGFGSGH